MQSCSSRQQAGDDFLHHAAVPASVQHGTRGVVTQLQPNPAAQLLPALRARHSRHVDLCRPWQQVVEPPHSLQSALSLLWAQMAVPPHSLHSALRRPWVKMDAPPHDLHFLALADSGQCKDCWGSTICIQVFVLCKDCGSSFVCCHGKRKYTCKEYRGSSICNGRSSERGLIGKLIFVKRHGVGAGPVAMSQQLIGFVVWSVPAPMKTKYF
jgi:hypothetical protein